MTLTVPSEMIVSFTCLQMDCNLKKHLFNAEAIPGMLDLC